MHGQSSVTSLAEQRVGDGSPQDGNVAKYLVYEGAGGVVGQVKVIDGIYGY